MGPAGAEDSLSAKGWPVVTCRNTTPPIRCGNIEIITPSECPGQCAVVVVVVVVVAAAAAAAAVVEEMVEGRLARHSTIDGLIS